MIRAKISRSSASLIIILQRRGTESDYVDIFANYLYSMVQTLFSFGDAVFQDDNFLIHTDRPIKAWFKEHQDEVIRLPWPSQYPDLNIIESL
ncbi:hypothetical protein AVEN_263346-1 [Araneus ventricosus]|uniref:Tc1-like transposase DDE domain-containing protein n=1 Tax=Araneus ventricosus TaxID=182803 RepID=A0A4Y2D171_ARAVE|nr:hypothetical protein AVEN_263346-1 [Araneus ventricosus]